MATDEMVRYRTALSLDALRDALRGALKEAELSALPQDVLDVPPALAFRAQKTSRLSGLGLIEVAVRENGDHRVVAIRAWSDSGLARAMQGVRNTVSAAGSRKLAGSVVEALAGSDRTLVRID